MSKVPKLRFKEFSGEWEEKSISDVLKIGSGKDYKHLESGDIPVFGTGGYMASVNDYLYDGESVCIGRKGTIDKPMFISGKFWTVDTLFYTHSYKNIMPKFLFAIFQRINWKQHNEASGVPSLSKSIIEPIKINIPKIEEQQKIASLLSAVDSKIDLLTHKKEFLKQYKKGVMQKIFSQELRFKADDGGEFPEWEEKKLGEVGKFSAGGDLDKLDYSKEKSEQYTYPIYANGAGQGLYGYATTFQYKSNCVTVSGRGNLGYANIRKENFNAIVRLIVIEPKANIESKFLEETINQINFAIESTGVPQLTVPQISSYKINIPSLKEQTKIANFLSAIDAKIDLSTKQFDEAKNFKKGLLQQMFV